MSTHFLCEEQISVLSILVEARELLTGRGIVDLSEGELNIGSVYVHLGTLEEMQCIQGEAKGEFIQSTNGPLIQRRYFAITDEGRRVLKENQSGQSGMPSQVPIFV